MRDVELYRQCLLRFVADSVPANVRGELTALPAQKQHEFVKAHNRRARSTGAVRAGRKGQVPGHMIGSMAVSDDPAPRS